ncbi:lytic transglycosylase F [Phyllobacterium brassicacearum]|uniref:Lytic transglycosylase F n=1 Tax=Phyllobacterium brassicacearum TaxID=314235 RepID=A0A2P7BRZ7_9HYPH|nr:lytic transglycosylase F [Phyllobacterium brassicacearum]PSH69234.1 lytic transglycosylase F [Phyllobacterium brassicacearum]TDQ25278.1 membrane-bound lytic murein transglycosylase MltF [Phyllobacterium brassicacearum]
MSYKIVVFRAFILGFALISRLAGGVGLAQEEQFASPHILDLDGMKQRRLVRVLVPYSKTIYFIDQGRQYGTAVEFGTALEKALNAGNKKEIDHIHVAFFPTARDRLLSALNEGLGDIVMANLTVTPSRLEQADFTNPIYDKASEVLITGPSSEKVLHLDDLSGKEIAVRETSSYYEHLIELNGEFKQRGMEGIKLLIMDENLEDEDLLEMVNADLLPYTIVDKYKAMIWSTIFTDIKVHDEFAIATDGQIAWAIRKNSPLLMKELNTFVAAHRVGTAFGNILRNKYFKSDKILQRAYSDNDVEKFKQLVEIFRKHGKTYSFDYLMLMAQGYQESKLDQKMRSPRGAVGVMQLLPATAKDKAVNINGIDKDEDRNVEAGSKYLRYLMDTYIDEPDLNERDRQLLAFAAYNAGPGNLNKFRQKAKDMGLNPNVWFGNVENAAASIVGRETVQYVSNIYKYYVAYTMLVERLGVHADAVDAGAKGG